MLWEAMLARLRASVVYGGGPAAGLVSGVECAVALPVVEYGAAIASAEHLSVFENFVLVVPEVRRVASIEGC